MSGGSKTGGPDSDPSDLLGGLDGEDIGFEFSTFEQSVEEEAYDHEEEPTAPRAVVDPVHERPVIDIQHVPKTDVTVDIRALGPFTVVTMFGRINESFEGERIAEQLGDKVVFDLTEVDRITSFGVRAWLQMFKAAQVREAVFVRASPAVVNQVTMIRNFCGPALIHSLVAPYGCASCGHEFGVPYDAIEDRESLLARRPLKVVCPDCGGTAEIIEDPWVFFSLDEQLLEEVSPDLSSVLRELGDAPQHNAIEKVVQGLTTVIQFNGEITGQARLQRAFAGLEGDVVLDFRTAPAISDDAVAGLLRWIETPSEVISRLAVEGAPLEMAERLLFVDDPRLELRSVMTWVRSLARPFKRKVCVELRRDREAILAGRVPTIDVPWRDDPLEMDGMAILQDAARRIELAATPAPAEPAAATKVSPAAVGAGSTLAMLALGGGVVAVLVLIGLGIGMVQFGSGGGVAATTGEGDGLAVEATVPDDFGEWSSGGQLPPVWSEVPVRLDDEGMLLVGGGIGDDLSTCARLARADAMGALLDYVGDEIDVPFDDARLPTEGPEAEQAREHFERAASRLELQRVEQASMRDAAGVHVVTRYRIDKEQLDAFLQDYQRRVDFQGLTLMQSPPWTEERVRLVKRASYVSNVVAGDVLLRVDDIPVDDLASFEEIAGERLSSQPPGGSFPLVFSRDGDEVITRVRRAQRAAPAPRPAAGDQRPTLFQKDD